MLASRPMVAAKPLRDLPVTESLRLRRRQGRASYLIALFTERRRAVTQSAVDQAADRAATRAARPA